MATASAAAYTELWCVFLVDLQSTGLSFLQGNATLRTTDAEGVRWVWQKRKRGAAAGVRW